MEYKDYYKILGISPDADAAAIKKAFRSLARKYHPDANQDDPGAEAKFKEINEAYEALKDAERRARYDQLRSNYQHWQRAGGQANGFDWSQWMSGAPGGPRVEYTGAGDLFSEFFKNIFGGAPSSYTTNFEDLFGGGGLGRRRSMPNQDLTTEVTITLEEAFYGTTRIISRDGRKLQVKIPAGARTGTRVRIAGQGAAGAGGAAGDLYLRVRVQDDERFSRDGDDLYLDVNLDLFTAVLGGEVDIPTMGKMVTLRISAGTQPGQLIRVRGKGLPNLRDNKKYGDLYVRVGVEIPQDLTDYERELFSELATLRGYGYHQ